MGVNFTISEEVNGKIKNRVIIFKDSYLLLPISLRKLCTAFNVDTPKTYFPMLLNDTCYEDYFPPLKYWGGDLTLDQWESLRIKHEVYFGELWSFKEESIKYCIIDCKCLHEIIVKFNELVFKEFKINIHKTLTAPSLAMKIYKALYMPKNSIYQILGDVEKDIRQSYTGGAVDSYIPHNGEDKVFFTKNKKKLYIIMIKTVYTLISCLLCIYL
jgi:hypothetical protein